MDTPRASLLVGSSYHLAEVGGPIISEYLREAGFDVEVTEDHDILSAGGLAELDLFVMWAEGCTTPVSGSEAWLTGDHARALAEWVAAGHSFLALHSAIAFSGQDVFDRLVGGVFVEHPPIAEFPVRVVDAAHPVTAGVEDFTIEDELYVTKAMTDDLHVLLEANWQDGATALGWTRSHGSGRVCYLANGHHEPALSVPAVKRLIQNGARWCVA